MQVPVRELHPWVHAGGGQVPAHQVWEAAAAQHATHLCCGDSAGKRFWQTPLLLSMCCCCRVCLACYVSEQSFCLFVSVISIPVIFDHCMLGVESSRNLWSIIQVRWQWSSDYPEAPTPHQWPRVLPCFPACVRENRLLLYWCSLCKSSRWSAADPTR